MVASRPTKDALMTRIQGVGERMEGEGMGGEGREKGKEREKEKGLV